jgi:hypothetical protein
MSINVAFAVLAPGGSPICNTGAMTMGRSYDGTFAYDLRTGGCAAALTDGAQLEGATVAAYVLRFDNGDIRPIVLRMRNVRLEVNSAAAVASAVSTTGAWTTPEGALVPGGTVASAVQDDTGSPSLRWATPGTEYSITLEDVAFPSGSITPDSVLDALEVELRAPTNAENFLSDPVDGARMTFDVLDGGTRVCGLQVDSHANSNRELRYDLFDGDCADQLATAGSVAGKDLRITFRTGCAQLSNFGSLPNLNDPSKCASVALPALDVVELVARTSTVTARPPTSQVTVNVGAAAAAGTSFDVYGDTRLPRSDLDIRWAGTHYSRPLFGGNLQVNGLGSSMAAGADSGIVCCSPRAGSGVIEADVGGYTRGQAAVRVAGDPVGGARAVTILDWKLCGRGGC